MQKPPPPELMHAYAIERPSGETDGSNDASATAFDTRTRRPLPSARSMTRSARPPRMAEPTTRRPPVPSDSTRYRPLPPPADAVYATAAASGENLAAPG